MLTSRLIVWLLLTVSLCILVHSQVDEVDVDGEESSESVISACEATMAPSTTRTFPDLYVLGFVTPWHGAGAEVASLAASHGRMDGVSAVAFVVRNGKVSGDFELASNAGGVTTRHPRFMFEDTEWMKNVDGVVEEISKVCEQVKARGAMIEAWHACSGDLRALLALGRDVRLAGLETTLAVPPLTKADVAGKLDVTVFKRGFDRIVVMAYDHARPGGEPGALAPISWVRDVAEHWCGALGENALLGLNFYGIDFAARLGVRRGERRKAGEDRHVTGNEILQLMKEHNPKLIYYEEHTVAEHVFEYNDGNMERLVYYPTRTSIKARLQVAKEEHCGGVAIWELGQGMPHFMDVF